MKIAVIGCTHAGTAAIVNMAKLYPKAEITVFERNDNISFLSCGIALYIGNVVKDPQGLFYSSPEALKNLGVDTRMNHNVISCDVQNKILEVENMKTKEKFSHKYDKMIVTTGSWPIIPNIPGINLENVKLCKNYDHAKEIISSAKNARKVAVVGAGYIGVELVESFADNGKEVILVDMEDRILTRYFDVEFTDRCQETMKEKGIKLALSEKVEKLTGDTSVKELITNQNKYDVDLVIMCIGFRPNTDIFKGQLDMTENGAIRIDEYMHTSNSDIMAAGDSCTVHYNPTGTQEYIPLATNAIRMGTLAAYNLLNPKLKYLGTQSTSGIKIYQHNLAATGLTESLAKHKGFKCSTIMLKDNHRPEFMPTYQQVELKLVYETETHIILGGQICSEADMTQTINTLSVCIQNKMKLEELAFIDFFFQPHFNKPWNLLNQVALNALSEIN